MYYIFKICKHIYNLNISFCIVVNGFYCNLGKFTGEGTSASSFRISPSTSNSGPDIDEMDDGYPSKYCFINFFSGGHFRYVILWMFLLFENSPTNE